MSKIIQDFCHLHQHTDYSLLDGCCKSSRLMKQVANLGMTSIAITDHGNLMGVPEFCSAAKDHGIKPIIGCEVYLVYDHPMTEKPRRDKKCYDEINDVPTHQDHLLNPADLPRHQMHHKGLLAKNFEGYQNLVKLVSQAHTEGFNYRPRTDVERVAQYSKGLIGLSGCSNGVAAQYLIYNDYDNARKATARFVDIFGKENYFIELQDHGLAIQRLIIPGLLKLAREFDLKVICTNDVHYVFKSDAEAHDALLCIQTGACVTDTNRMKYPCNEFYLKSRAEMALLFKEIPQALDNTLLVAEMCNVKLPFGENHYPTFTVRKKSAYPKDHANFNRILDIYQSQKNALLERREKPLIQLTVEDRAKYSERGIYLFDLCKQGLKDRYEIDYDTVRAITQNEKHTPPESLFNRTWNEVVALCDKLDYEIAIITGTGFADYFLIVWDIINWARKKKIPVGPGRGSGVGCMVAYILRITDVDPLRFGLLFERMLNLEYVIAPDFDIDFCMRRHDEVVKYVYKKYGRDRVANIITYGTFGAKRVVRDLARVLDLPYAEADRLAKMIPDEPFMITFEQSLEQSRELAYEVEVNSTANKIITHGTIIEGMVRNTGRHPCGVIISDRPLTDSVPLTLQEGAITTQYDKDTLENQLGLLKLDLLGMKALTIITDAEENVRRTRALKSFDTKTIPLDDPATYALLNNGQTVCVFQLENSGMRELFRQLKISCFEEIIALIALYRPGSMDFIPQFIKGKEDPKTIEVPHPLIKELVKETYGIVVYQEQVMQIAQIIAGYTLGDADLLRRAMGKNDKEVMERQKDLFVEGAKKANNIDRKTAEHIFAFLQKFAKYSCNKAHYTAYALVAYRTAYLKANYPVEFMTAVLPIERGIADRVACIIAECKVMNIPVSETDINDQAELT